MGRGQHRLQQAQGHQDRQPLLLQPQPFLHLVAGAGQGQVGQQGGLAAAGPTHDGQPLVAVHHLADSQAAPGGGALQLGTGHLGPQRDVHLLQFDGHRRSGAQAADVEAAVLVNQIGQVPPAKAPARAQAAQNPGQPLAYMLKGRLEHAAQDQPYQPGHDAQQDGSPVLIPPRRRWPRLGCGRDHDDLGHGRGGDHQRGGRGRCGRGALRPGPTDD